MQWGDGVNDGFSTASADSLYITMDADENRPTVKKQEEEETSLLNYIRTLTKIRLDNEALQSNATVTFEYVDDYAYPLVYKRTGNNQTVLVALNPSDKKVRCTIPTKEVSKVLHAYPNVATLEDGKLTVPAGGVTFFEV
ncbi:alpha-amylase family glycosyl hydrolase [Anaerosporobacter sp.]